MPLQSIPIMLAKQTKVEMAAAPNFSSAPSKFTETHQTTSYHESFQKFQETNQSVTEMENAHFLSRGSFNQGSAAYRQTHDTRYLTTLYDDIALPDTFLEEYYSQVLCLSFKQLCPFFHLQKYVHSSLTPMSVLFLCT